MPDPKDKIITPDIKTYDDPGTPQPDPQRVRVKTGTLKTADPGVAFVLETIDGTPIDHAVDIRLDIYDPDGGHHYSILKVWQQVFDKEISCIMPFGDKDWPNFVKSAPTVTIKFTVELIPCGEYGQPLPDGGVIWNTFTYKNIPAQSGKFKVTVVQAGGGGQRRRKGLLGRIFRGRK